LNDLSWQFPFQRRGTIMYVFRISGLPSSFKVMWLIGTVAVTKKRQHASLCSLRHNLILDLYTVAHCWASRSERPYVLLLLLLSRYYYAARSKALGLYFAWVSSFCILDCTECIRCRLLLPMIAVSVCLSVTLFNSAARAMCAGSVGAAFAKLRWPLLILLTPELMYRDRPNGRPSFIYRRWVTWLNSRKIHRNFPTSPLFLLRGNKSQILTQISTTRLRSSVISNWMTFFLEI